MALARLAPWGHIESTSGVAVGIGLESRSGGFQAAPSSTLRPKNDSDPDPNPEKTPLLAAEHRIIKGFRCVLKRRQRTLRRRYRRIH